MADFASALDEVVSGGAPPTPSGIAPPVAGAAPPTPANDAFGDALDSVTANLRSPSAPPDANRNNEELWDANANLISSRGVAPDAAGRAAISAQETGIPLDVAMRNIATVDEEARRQRDAKTLRETRGTARFFSDQRNAAVAHDKVAQMGTWERLLYAAGLGAEEGYTTTEVSPLIEKEMNGQPLTPGEKVLVEGWRSRRKAPTGLPEWGVSAAVHNGAAFVTGMTSQIVASAPLALAGGLAAGGITAASGFEPLVPAMTAAGASAGLQTGMFDQGRKQATAFTYERLRELDDEQGRHLDPDTVRYVANGVGVIGGFLNIVGMGQVAKPLGTLAQSVTRMLIEDAAAKPSVAVALKAIGGGTAKGFGMGLGLGAANESSMVAGETLAAEINNILRGTKFTDILNDSAKREEAAKAIAESAVSMGLTLAGVHIASGAPRLAADGVRIHRAAQDAKFYDAIVNGAEASGLAERPTGRDAIQRWLGIHLDDGPHDTVYIPATKLVELYQDAARIGAENDPMLGHIEGLQRQIADALPVNGDVAIPSKDFFSKLVGTPALERLKGDLRMREDGYSLNEAKEAMKQRDAILKASQERWEAEAEAGHPMDPGSRVYEHMRDQLILGNGFTQTAAVHQAGLYAAHYEARATAAPHLYADAWDAYQKAGRGQGVEIRSEVPERIRVTPPDQLDVLLNSLRTGKDPAPPKPPPSLLDYIARRGGMVDEGGELKARDLGKWHIDDKGRKIRGRSPLIAEGDAGQISMFGGGGRKNTLHDTAISAWEDGFFPDRAEAPTQDHLLAAIDAEMRHGPAATEEGLHNAVSAFREDRAILDETLNRLGLDVKTATNAQIREALAKVHEESGRTLEQTGYHGSPHVFDKFTLDHIGSGEGAQAFGWGLYFAGRKAVGQYYRESLAGQQEIKVGGKALNPKRLSTDAWIAWRALANAESVEKAIAESDTGPAKILREWEQAGIERSGGRLYHVDIPEDGVYLHWDKPLAEQSESVKEGLKKVVASMVRESGDRGEVGRELQRAFDTGKMTGKEIYTLLKLSADGRDQAKAASLELNRAGIPGIQYLEGAARAKGEGAHNYVLFDDALVSIKQYEQSKRGSINLGDGATVIRLFQTRDLSTLLHETGHLWLEELRVDALSSGASKELTASWDATLKHLGIDPATWDGEFTRDQHEKFARSFETYLMEGKAPSTALANAFRSFKNWLVQIYRKLSALDAPLSPEMRDVFDRLVATDDEIKAAREKQSINPIFKDAKAAGMSPAQFRAYTDRVTAVVNEAEQRVLAKAMAGIRAKRTAEWKAEEKLTRAEVRAEAMADPGQQALHYLRTGKIYDGETPEGLAGGKLSRADIVATYGDESALRMLPRDTYRAEGGFSADSLAGLFGFDSGRAMLDRMMDIEAERVAMVEKGDKRSVLRAAIDRETADRMNERMGGHLDEQAIAEEAMAAVHGPKQEALMGAELTALARRAGEPVSIGVGDVKAWAAQTVGEMPARDAQRFDRYLKAERTAGLAAERALMKGDYVGAFKAKQDQLANMLLYAEAKKAAGEIDSARKLLDHYAGERTIKSMDQDYLEQIHGLLGDYDFKRRSDREIGRVAKFEVWAANQAASGIDHLGEALSPRMKAQIGRLNYKDMTVNEVRGLGDTVKQIAKLGRLAKELTLNAEKRDFDKTMDELVSHLRTLRQVGISEERNPSVAGAGMAEAKRAWLVRTKAGLRGADSALVKMEELFDWADGGNSNGLMNSLIFRRIADRQNFENDMLTVYTTKLNAIGGAVPKETIKGWTERLDIPDLKSVTPGRSKGAFLKSDLIAIALNMGNEGNKDKMLRGDGWSEEAVKAALDKHLTKADWDYVQAVWDLSETLWPHIAALEREVNGVEPEKVVASEVETPFGKYRGGYHPVAYDITLSADARVRIGMPESSVFGDPRATRATTSQGFTEGRTGYAAPILLDLGVIPRHLAEVIHDLSFRQAIRQADKIFRDKRFVEAFTEAFGPEFYDQLNPWLKRIAGDAGMDKTGLSWWEKTLKEVRINTSMVGMGIRASTMINQVTGNFDTMEVLGSRWAAVGHASFVGDPINMAATKDFIFEKSGEMRHRMDNLERDVRDGLRTLLGQKSALSEVRRYAFYGIGMMDMTVSMPAWMGGYKKALHEGMSDADAVYYADKVVRQSQGSGGAKDLSAWHGTSNEAMKLSTMFYSWASHFYNRTRAIGRDVRDADSVGDFAMIAARSMYLVLLPAIAGPLMTASGPKEDESAAAWAMRKVAFGAFQGIPIARDIASYAERKVGGDFAQYSPTPAARGIDVMEKLLVDIAHGSGLVEGDVSDKWLQHAIEAPGYLFGLPTGQPASTTQFLWDIHTGNQTADSVGEWYRGLLKGKAKND